MSADDTILTGNMPAVTGSTPGDATSDEQVIRDKLLELIKDPKRFLGIACSAKSGLSSEDRFYDEDTDPQEFLDVTLWLTHEVEFVEMCLVPDAEGSQGAVIT